jgi:hypothetical protein
MAHFSVWLLLYKRKLYRESTLKDDGDNWNISCEMERVLLIAWYKLGCEILHTISINIRSTGLEKGESSYNTRFTDYLISVLDNLIYINLLII